MFSCSTGVSFCKLGSARHPDGSRADASCCGRWPDWGIMQRRLYKRHQPLVPPSAASLCLPLCGNVFPPRGICVSVSNSPCHQVSTANTHRQARKTHDKTGYLWRSLHSPGYCGYLLFGLWIAVAWLLAVGSGLQVWVEARRRGWKNASNSLATSHTRVLSLHVEVLHVSHSGNHFGILDMVRQDPHRMEKSLPERRNATAFTKRCRETHLAFWCSLAAKRSIAFPVLS